MRGIYRADRVPPGNRGYCVTNHHGVTWMLECGRCGVHRETGFFTRSGRDIDRLLDPNRPNPICVLCAPVPAPVEFKVCSICKLGRRRDRFTASQWSIGAGRQCKDCKGWFQPGVHSWSNTEDQ
jgi:hypothetical protein